MDVNAGKSARLIAQYKEVLLERDYLKKRLELAQKMIEEERALREDAQKARDALAAHVETLHSAIDDLLEGEPIDSFNRDINGLLGPLFGTDEKYCEKAGRALREIREEPPPKPASPDVTY